MMAAVERVKNAADFCRPDKVAPLPAGAAANWGMTAVLKPHQEEGVAWLIDRYQRGVNVILADEMGLGKTVQAIALIAYLHTEKHVPGPFLVISPLSVTEGWASELKRFAPKLRYIRYTGDREQREKIRREIAEGVNTFPVEKRADPKLKFEVLMTTYELAMLDAAFLTRFRWRMCIIDEAQRLRNADSVLYKTLNERYMLPRRLLLTGTPVQNNLSELGALLHFCMPKIFPDAASFSVAFGPAADASKKQSVNAPSSSPGEDSLATLRAALHSFMLRRTKAALVTAGTLSLAPLAEVALFAPMVPLQKRVYLSILRKELSRLVGNSQAGTLQNIVVQLRKACSHPYLFGGVEPEPFEGGEHLVEASGKLLLLDMLLSKLKAGGHTVLIFAQMARTLDILQDCLEMRHYSYERLDGSVRAEERFEAVKKFSGQTADKDGSPFVFLLTTRAGGVGLNLVAADTVIFFELDWNPQADLQAMQRAHRIGQLRHVLAIRLVTQHSVEEVILRRSKRKLRLTRDVIGRNDDEVEAQGAVASNAQELKDMIQFGLHRLGDDASNDASQIAHLKEALAPLVKSALEQRDKSARARSPAQLSELERDDESEDEENIYSYEGKDYSGRKKAERSDEDRDALQRLAENGGAAERAQPGKRRPRSEPDEKAVEEAQARKRQKAEEKKKAKWAEMGYESLAVGEPEPSDLKDRGPGEAEDEDVSFVIGDVTKPKRGAPDEPAIIVSCCDNSGVWGRGGMFRALEGLSAAVPEAYEAAGQAGDLHLGDLHMIPIEGPSNGVSTSKPEPLMYVGLAIAQEYDRRRKEPRSDLLPDAFKSALEKLAGVALQKKASVHLPRLTVSSGGGRGDWYAVERLLRKCLTSRGVTINVYYYRRSAASGD